MVSGVTIDLDRQVSGLADSAEVGRLMIIDTSHGVPDEGLAAMAVQQLYHLFRVALRCP